MTHGKSLEIFLADGTANGTVTAELSNWTGKCVKIPRHEVETCIREDISHVGVYFLFCKENNGTNSVYIGGAENVKERLMEHLQDFKSEKEYFYWDRALVFTGKELTKDMVNYLKNKLINQARNCKRYVVLNNCVYTNLTVKESRVAVMNEFIDNIKIILGTFGCDVLNPLVGVAPKKEVSNTVSVTHVSTNSALGIQNEYTSYELMFFKVGNTHATGVETPEGFIIHKGAVINRKSSISLSKKLRMRREQLMVEGKIKDLTTTEDLFFSSHQTAACFILGYTCGATHCWKNKDGVSIFDIKKAANIG